MAKIKITDLEEISAVTEDEYYIPVDNGSETKKISVKNYNFSANTTAASYAKSAQANAERAATSATEARSIASEVSNNTSAAESAATEAAQSAKEAKTSIQGLQAYVDKASASANSAQQSAKSAESYAGSVATITETAKSWAIGGTGQRTDEDTNNAKYWAQKAQGMLTGVSSFNGRWGDVMPQKGDYTPEMLEIVADAELDKTSTQPIQNKPVAEAVETINTTIADMKQSFTDGCNTLVNKLKELGVTPTSNSPSDIAAAIETLATNKYNQGVEAADARVNTSSASYTSGRSQGQSDVTSDPNTYTLYTKTQMDANYNSGRTQGRTDVENSPNTYGLYSYNDYIGYGNTQYSSGRSQGQADVKANPNTYGLYSYNQYVSYGSSQYNSGYSAGRSQGQADVKGNPNSYGLYSADQYNARYNAGVSAVTSNPTAYNLYSGAMSIQFAVRWEGNDPNGNLYLCNRTAGDSQWISYNMGAWEDSGYLVGVKSLAEVAAGR